MQAVTRGPSKAPAAREVGWAAGTKAGRCMGRAITAAASEQDSRRRHHVRHPSPTSESNITPGSLLRAEPGKARAPHLPSPEPCAPAEAAPAGDGSARAPQPAFLQHGLADGCLEGSQPAIPVSGAFMVELVLGRLAMVGFVGSTAIWLFTGLPPLEQAMRYKDNVVLITCAIVFSSLFVRKIDPGLEVRFLPAFSLRAERLNGQLAMLGCAALVAWQLPAW